MEAERVLNDLYKKINETGCEGHLPVAIFRVTFVDSSVNAVSSSESLTSTVFCVSDRVSVSAAYTVTLDNSIRHDKTRAIKRFPFSLIF